MQEFLFKGLSLKPLWGIEKQLSKLSIAKSQPFTSKVIHRG
jgi:hypothetical protein